MRKLEIGTLKLAFVLAAATGFPVAAANPASCSDTAPAVLRDISSAPQEKRLRDADVRPPAGVIRASYSPPRTKLERPRQPPAEPAPEPGGWATLLAGVLGLATMARRRIP